jgi:hypothetical protein
MAISGSKFFKKELTVYGVRIVAAGDVGGQAAVPDAFVEKVAQTFKLLLNRDDPNINSAAQTQAINTLAGANGTYHAGKPTIQRIARGAGSDYSTNFLTDEGIIFWELSEFFDATVQNDMVWYLNSTGETQGDGDGDAQEVLEHVMHTLHMHGLDAQGLKLYPFLNSDWNTGPLYNAMVEAYDGGFWDPSGYGGEDFKTSGDAFEVAAKEYLYLLNFCMFDYSTLWEGASLAPEWADTVATPAGIAANLPLGLALYNTYIAPVVSKMPLDTIRSIFQDGDVGDPTIAGDSGYSVQQTAASKVLEDSWNSDYWKLWLPGLDFDGVYDENIIYQPGDVVQYGGYLFQSKVINNIGNKPSTTYGDDSTDAWELITSAYDITGDYNISTAYKVGSIVTYGGDVYVSIVDTQGQIPGDFQVQAVYESEGSSGTTIKLNTADSTDPAAITIGMNVVGEGFDGNQSVEAVSVDEGTGITTVTLNYAPAGTVSDSAVLTFVGSSYEYWELLIPGFQWEGRWTSDRLYNQDDIAYFGNATYVSLREHTSALVNRPDLDLQNNYWTVYLQHDQRNILSNPGELITRGVEDNVPLAIGPNASILKVVNSLPAWSSIDFTPNVYYVATNGVDVPTGGTTPDTAWASVNYACAQVLEGTLQQNAKILLEQNKEWVIQEIFYWFLHQQNENFAPFDSSYNFDNEKVIRDARLIYDGVVRDLIRGGNAVTVENALSYFDLESTNSFTNAGVAEQREYFQVFFVELFNFIERALTNSIPADSYQLLEGVESPVTQYINNGLTLESDTLTRVGALERIYLQSFLEGSYLSIPPANESAYSTIFIRAGTYNENIPIVIPAFTALNGDELRGTTIQPKNPVNTLCTRTTGDVNLFTVGSTVNMENNTPVQFVSLNPVDEISTVFGEVVAGQTYYVIGSTITDTQFQVSETKDGPPLELFTNLGDMYVYGGEALHDMFYVRNGTGIRNMTVKGLRGTLTAENEYLTRRPTGGAYVSLDPGTGPDDTRAWITRKSPYVQNVTTFGLGCVGLKIDSTLHNGGNRSVVSNDFTQILSDGIGIWCKGGDALTEAVSVFSYYGYAGYFAEDGARVRATNGNSSYGTYGCVAEGFDLAETPALGSVNNTSGEATAKAVGALGADAEILKIQYTHAGEQYYKSATNLLTQSNNLLSSDWVNDSNVGVVRAPSTPYENEFAWKVNATTSLTDSAYYEQTVSAVPQGRTYTNVGGVNISGSGTNATFDVTVTANDYTVTVNNGGENYVIGNQITLSGKSFGGRSPENDITVEVETLSITAINQIQFSGTVPEGSALPYNVSIHVQAGTAAYVDLYAIFGGVSERTYTARYNFGTETFTTQIATGATFPATNLQASFLQDGWYRLTFTVVDETAQNSNLKFRVYPRGIDGIAGFTNFYGAQITLGQDPIFFVDTGDKTPSTYANIKITGAGQNVEVIGDELRTNSVFQLRLLESEEVRLGGLGYKIQTNNAQTGTTEYLTLAGSEVATAAEYEGMRLFVKSGKGAGQFGIIADYNPTSKEASVVKESFDPREVIISNSTTDEFTLAPGTDFYNIYPGQPIQFTPTFYDILTPSTAQSAVNVLGTLGDLNNYMYVSSTARLKTGQKINFSGTPFGGVITGFDYYIIDVIDDRSIQLSTSLGGAVWPLSNVNIDDPDDSPIVLTGEVAGFTLNYPDDTSYITANTTANMQVTLPIQFTSTSIGGITLGETYYINEVYNGTQFSISSSLVDVDVTATSSSNNALTVADSSVLLPMNAVIFKGDTLGGVVEKTKYYINSIIDGTNFTLSSGTITQTATATAGISNLITVDSTAGFIANAPIVFSGVTFGGLVNDKIYYIQVVNDATSFTISEVPAGAAVPLTTTTGSIIVRTVVDELTLTDATGTMSGKTTGTKEVVTSGRGGMEASFFTEIFGGIAQGTTYYVKSKNELDSAALALELATDDTLATTVSLTDADGSMQIQSIGWDHINAGTPPVTTFDSTSIYQIEPRITLDRPVFTVEDVIDPNTETAQLLPATEDDNQDTLPDGYAVLVSDQYRIFAVPKAGDTLLSTSDYTYWDQSYTLPISGSIATNGGWIDAVHGNNTFIIISKSGQDSLTSVSQGLTWLSTNLPALPAGESYYSSIAYGNNTFVAVARGAENSAYSTNNGITWTEVTGAIGASGEEDWVDIAYGNNCFVAISGSNNEVKYSTDNGLNWSAAAISDDSTIDNWRRIEFGNGRFVAISSDDRSSVYSFDGITWFTSNTNVSGTLMKYAQGVFLVIDPVTGISYTSSDGFNWQQELSTSGGSYGAIGFGMDTTERKGMFLTVDEIGETSTKINAGSRAIARADVQSAKITDITLLEPGSGYTDDSFGPKIKITDPNNSEEAAVQVRIGSGTLGAPSFADFGSGYNTTSTSIAIRGEGFSDSFQTGLNLIAKGITRFPAPGDNLQFEGNPEVYRVATATALRGTTTPNLEAVINLSPQITQETSPAHNTPFTIRSRFSQVRITNHDFLNIGFGNEIQSNYPLLPENTGLEPQDEIVETNNGRVFYSSTDQDGNFRVGDLFAVEQATGVVTLSASEFGLDGLTELTIGGVALGGSPVTVSEFSTDGTFVANSNNIVPTQKAIRTYLSSRLSQGGSDTFTGLLQAGTVKVGGPDEITSSIPEGGEGYQVKMGAKTNVNGPLAGWGGDGLAMAYFMKTFVDPTRGDLQ